MSMSSANLAGVLTIRRPLSPADADRLRRTWADAYTGRRVAVLEPGWSLETLIRDGQNRFKAPHLRDYGYRLPIPFRWGPNGSLILLLAMLGGYAMLAAIVFLIGAGV